MNRLIKFSLLALVAVMSAFGQATTTSTTLSVTVSPSTTTQWCIASATGVTLPGIGNAGSYLVVDREAAQITSQGTSSTCFNVKRGQLATSANAGHVSGTTVWVGNAATGSGDSSRPYTGTFVSNVPSGPCTASAQYTLPVILVSAVPGGSVGNIYTCAGGSGRWGQLAEFYVSPSQCTFAPTTSTVTNTYPQIGASTVFVLNGTTNAAAGTTTLTCNILIPTKVGNGAVITDITLFVGSQTTAPTSLGTSTLGSITFPAAATSETASTVTPVAVGGTVTTVSPTAITTVTTAGSFLTIKHTYASVVSLSTDLQILQYTMPFLQSAAAAMTLNTPGLIVHYFAPNGA